MYWYHYIHKMFVEMQFDRFLCVSLLFAFRVKIAKCMSSSHITSKLEPCYNGSFSMVDKPPLTIPLLVEILRKVELYDRTTINLRILTTALLHEIIFDGVLKSDRVGGGEGLPYRARGHEFYKYKLVADYLVSGESILFENESLSQEEICYLHNMISTVNDIRYRGDEEVTCSYIKPEMPVPKIELQSENLLRSNCPLMKGNINTSWGTITIGHLIYGMSASLQNTRTSFANIIHAINKTKGKYDTITVNSIWIATLAGDLAEAVLNQATNNLILGTSGFWNDSVLPASYYLTDIFSELTESKLLGGIDGLIVASHIVEWEKILMTTKLSQIIDMYYSNRGIAFNYTIRASNRNVEFNSILRNLNLTEQIIGTTNLLKEVGIYDSLLSDHDIAELSSFAVEKFEELSDEVTKRYDLLDHVNEISLRSNLEIILILDGTFDFYTSKQFVYSLAEAAQVSYHESKLGIIDGETGTWISNITGEIFDLFRGMNNAENSWPTQLSLHLSFETIMAHYQNVTRNNCTGSPKRPLGRAIVLLSNKVRPTNSDTNKYKEDLFSIKNAFPETNVLYVLSEDVQDYFKELSHLYQNDSIIRFSRDILTLSTSIATKLHEIPGQIVNIFCDNSNSRMEDYLTPGIDKFYEINAEYTRRYHFKMKFHGNDYGEILICTNGHGASPNETCRRITVNDEVTFNSKDLCPADSRCNLQFVLKVNNSNFRCAENDCRYPDQVRLGITWTTSGSGFLRELPYLYLVLAFLLTRLGSFT